MTNDQCRAARAILNLSQPALAKLASVGVNGLQSFETGRKELSTRVMRKLRMALIREGVEFLDDENGIGVRRRRTLDEIRQPAVPVALGAETAADRDRLPTQERPIAPRQCRAARGFLSWSQKEAAAELGVGLSMIVGFENETSVPQMRNLCRMRAGFEARGIPFSDTGGALSVSRVGSDRLRRRRPAFCPGAFDIMFPAEIGPPCRWTQSSVGEV